MSWQNVATKLTDDFWLLSGRLLYVKNREFLEELTEKKSIEYALDICGDDVFDCELSDDGDPAIETTGIVVADEELFNKLVEQLKST